MLERWFDALCCRYRTIRRFFVEEDFAYVLYRARRLRRYRGRRALERAAVPAHFKADYFCPHIKECPDPLTCSERGVDKWINPNYPARRAKDEQAWNRLGELAHAPRRTVPLYDHAAVNRARATGNLEGQQNMRTPDELHQAWLDGQRNISVTRRSPK